MTAFIDTNVFVYLVDPLAPAKRQRAMELIQTLYLAGDATLSTQVLQEFYNTATRKFGLPGDVAAEAAQAHARGRVVRMSPDIVFSAMKRHTAGQFSFWDSLIVEAALSGGCKILYSEDMRHGQVVDGMTIENPFLGI
ncbi:MAG: PIN domain-containing protein [Pseudomonadota bacterium]